MRKHHTQILIRAEVTKPLLFADRATDFMRRAIKIAGMQVVCGPFSFEGQPGNEGISSIAGLDFSSATLHEWPDEVPFPLIHFDLYTCGESPRVDKFEALFAELECVRFSAAVIDRDKLLDANSSFVLECSWPIKKKISTESR